MATRWLNQIYAACIPAYPIGYLMVHGLRGDQFWTKPYVSRSSVPVNDHLKELVESELDKLHVVKNPKVSVYLTDDMEPRVYGGFFLNPGAEIQFPIQVSFEDVEAARRLGANLELDMGLARNRRKIEVNSAIGDELVSRLMLSDAAKKFIIQRELIISNNGVFFCLPIFAWMGVFSAGYAVMTGISVVSSPVIGFVLSIGLSLAVFYQMLHACDDYKLKKADELTVEQGEEYLLGARDYFQSLMKFNRLLRRVLAEDGEASISKSGDSKLDRISYTTRLKLIEGHYKRYIKEQKEIAEALAFKEKQG